LAGRSGKGTREEFVPARRAAAPERIGMGRGGRGGAKELLKLPVRRRLGGLQMKWGDEGRGRVAPARRAALKRIGGGEGRRVSSC
jgi:hypothetical protein